MIKAIRVKNAPLKTHSYCKIMGQILKLPPWPWKLFYKSLQPCCLQTGHLALWENHYCNKINYRSLHLVIIWILLHFHFLFWGSRNATRDFTSLGGLGAWHMCSHAMHPHPAQLDGGERGWSPPPSPPCTHIAQLMNKRSLLVVWGIHQYGPRSSAPEPSIPSNFFFLQ